MRIRGLQEIFHYYSRQHIPNNKEFDHLKEKMNQVDIGEFMVFCKDFNIQSITTKVKLTEIFKKSSLNHQPLKFEQFQTSIQKIGAEIHRQKVEDQQKKLKELNKEIQRKQREMKKQFEESKMNEEEDMQ